MKMIMVIATAAVSLSPLALSREPSCLDDPSIKVFVADYGGQKESSIACFSDGRSVVVWAQHEPFNAQTELGIYGQLLGAEGNTIGTRFKISTLSHDSLMRPDVAPFSDGGFVVTYFVPRSGWQPGIVLAQRFDRDGTKEGDEIEVKNTSNGYTGYPVVAVNAQDEFLIVFHGPTATDDHALLAQYFDRSGERIGEEFGVNAPNAASVHLPAVAFCRDGGFVVAWQSGDGSQEGVFAQKFDGRNTLIGPEVRVNTHSANAQRNPSVTAFADGGYIVVWDSYAQDGDEEGIYAQRFDAESGRVGGEFQVNTTTYADQTLPKVAVFRDGAFVVAWQSDGGECPPGTAYLDLCIKAQYFDAAAAPVGDEFTANALIHGAQHRPDIAVSEDGIVTITWDGPVGTCTSCGGTSRAGIVAERFDRHANRLREDFRVNEEGVARNPAIGGYGHKDFLVAWQTGTYDILGRVVDRNGDLREGEIPLAASSHAEESQPQLARLKDNRTVLVWAERDRDGSGLGVFGKVIANPFRLVSEFATNAHTSGDQQWPAVAALEAGGFAVAWSSAGQDGSGEGVFGRTFDAVGKPISDEFRVNTFTERSQDYPGIAGLSDGGFAVAWQSANQDEGRAGVYVQVFDGGGNKVGEETKVFE
ncbi:MAG: hypothetical protein JXP34_21590, partial [Planctomycetes bacterium]|nr:hypothetical protein [Planctomycetota bacterium]